MATVKKFLLISSDYVAYEVDADAAMESQTIKRMVELNGTVGGIPIPNLHSSILSKVIQYFHILSLHATSPEEVEEQLDARKQEQLNDCIAQFIREHQKFLFNLVLAAEFLEIPRLRDLTRQSLVGKLMDLSIENKDDVDDMNLGDEDVEYTFDGDVKYTGDEDVKYTGDEDVDYTFDEDVDYKDGDDYCWARETK